MRCGTYGAACSGWRPWGFWCSSLFLPLLAVAVVLLVGGAGLEAAVVAWMALGSVLWIRFGPNQRRRRSRVA